MAIVNYINEADAAAPVKEVYAKAEAYFGHVPNLVKALGSNQAMCTSITEFLIQSLGKGRVDWAFKELVILKTLRSMKSFYSYGAHERLAVLLGNSEDKIGDLANSLWQNSPHFSESEKMVFELVDQIGVDANDVSEGLWNRLKEHWDNGQLLELNAVITTLLMIGRVGDSLGVTDTMIFSKAVPA